MTKIRPESLKPKPFKKDGAWCWMLEDGSLINMTSTEEDIFEWLEKQVQGLLEEIEKEIKKERKLMKTEYEEGFTDGYKCACYDITKKIKKWFSDVVEDEV